MRHQIATENCRLIAVDNSPAMVTPFLEVLQKKGLVAVVTPQLC
jgi:tRNA (cmo5U34)-methyltransferase